MYEENLLYKITWYYYVNNMTQVEIATHLKISRMKVVKLLSQAKNEGIVKFKINNNAVDRVNLELEMLNRFGLDDVFIVPTTPENLNDNLARGAAEYIEAKAEPNSYINIGYGDTISKTVNHLIYSIETPISLVTLSGGVSYYMSAIISAAHKKSPSSATPTIHMLPAPLIASTKEVASIFLNESGVKNILDMSKHSSMTVVGIGHASEDATIFKYNIANKEDLVLLKMQGAVGDILSQFFDKDGNIVESDLHSKLVSIKLDYLKQSKNIVAVSGGANKVQAIYSALKGNYINVLITDEITAKQLLVHKNK